MEIANVQIPNPKSQTNSKTPNSKPRIPGSATVLGEKRVRTSCSLPGEIMGKPWPFLGQSMGPSTTGGFDGFEFGICLGFGISPEQPSIRNKKSIGHTFADPFYKHSISLGIRVVNPLLWRLWDACVSDFEFRGAPSCHLTGRQKSERLCYKISRLRIQ
jgi:hypothetical protein